MRQPIAARKHTRIEVAWMRAALPKLRKPYPRVRITQRQINAQARNWILFGEGEDK